MLYYLTSPHRSHALVTIAATGPVTDASSISLTFKSTGKLAEVDVTVGQQVMSATLSQTRHSDSDGAKTSPGDLAQNHSRISDKTAAGDAQPRYRAQSMLRRLRWLVCTTCRPPRRPPNTTLASAQATQFA